MLPTAPCMVCPRDDRMARQRGCDGKPAPSPVKIDETKGVTSVYWHCPKKFIPFSIYIWYKEYAYHQKFSSAPMPSFHNVSSRFIEAVNVYDSTLQEYADFMEKRRSRK